MSKFNSSNHSQSEIDNRANQLNQNNPAYSSSRSGNSKSGINYDDVYDEDYHIQKLEKTKKLKTRKSHIPLASFNDVSFGGEMKFVKIPAGCKVYEEDSIYDVKHETFLNMSAIFSISGQLLKEDRKITIPGLGSLLLEANKGEFYHVKLTKQKISFDENCTELFIPVKMKSTFDSIMEAIC